MDGVRWARRSGSAFLFILVVQRIFSCLVHHTLSTPCTEWRIFPLAFYVFLWWSVLKCVSLSLSNHEFILTPTTEARKIMDGIFRIALPCGQIFSRTQLRLDTELLKICPLFRHLSWSWASCWNLVPSDLHMGYMQVCGRDRNKTQFPFLPSNALTTRPSSSSSRLLPNLLHTIQTAAVSAAEVL